MKITSFKEFAELPEGTVYSYFEPFITRGLMRKGETIYSEERPIDFFFASIQAECEMMEPPAVDTIEGRWGLFDDEQLFAVYEPEDIAAMARMMGINP